MDMSNQQTMQRIQVQSVEDTIVAIRKAGLSDKNVESICNRNKVSEKRVRAITGWIKGGTQKDY
jgi:hypothetical protein